MENLEFDKHLKKAITAEERQNLKIYLQSLEKKANKPQTKNWLIAASILIVIGFTSYFSFFNKPISNQNLYAENFVPYRNVVVPIVRNQVKKSKKIEAFTLYETAEYKKALELLNQLNEKDSIDVNTIRFYKANAYLKLEKPNEAIKNLLSIAKYSKWQKESLWYLALSYLKIEKPNLAKKELIKLNKINKNQLKKEQIENILKHLN